MTSLLKDYPWTDAGNSERLIAQFGVNMKYIPSWGEWISWHGTRWELDAGYPYRMAEHVARKMYAEADGLKDDNPLKEGAKAFARKSESAAAIEACLKLARHRVGVTLSHEKLDGNPMILPVKNGTVELATGRLRASKRDDFCTVRLDIPWEPGAKCPLWEGFLLKAMGGDKDTVNFLQRCVGYSLTGHVGEHVLFFSHGPKGMNGKSTFLSILRHLMGGYGAMAPRKLLFQGIGDRHPTELTTLFGKRLVTCSEVPENQAFDEALLKDLTGGEVIRARGMREDFWEYSPTHKLWLAGNHKPIITGTDGGIWRRIVLIPWEIIIPEKDRDIDFTDKLRKELPGILSWAVRGCLAWQRDRLKAPKAIENATKQYRIESDILGEFFRQYCAFEPDAKVSKQALRLKYHEWCESLGASELGAVKFSRRLREQGCDDCSVRPPVKQAGSGKLVAGAPVDGWRGVRLLTQAEREAVKRWAP